MGTPARIDGGIPGVRLSRFHADNGTSATGQYPGLDRFGRLARQLWTDDDFGPHGSVGTVPNKPPVLSVAYTYDNASSRTGAFDARPGAEQPLSHMYAYDGLHRLIDARRGVWNGDLGTPSVTPAKWSQEWSLDPLGNWDSVGTDGMLPVPTETRDHRDDPNGDPENRVNQLMSRTLSTAAGGATVAIEYDFAGNMLRQELTKVGTDTTALRFTHDAWNRLVKVEFEDDEEELHDRGEYEYNGLNWRTVRRFDSNDSLELDTEQVLLYDADWRLLERRVNSAYDPLEEEPEIDRIIHHVWGLRYIDDIVATRHDINPSAENGHELIFFHVTDAQFSTVAMLSDTGAVLERVTYTAYGVARHHWPTDVTGDGEVDSADLGAVLNAYGNIDDPEYRSEADFDRDGVVGGADLGAVLTFLTARPDGVLSSAAVNNEIGYAGYQFAPEAGNLGAYLARNRWLDSELGRWRQRDPLGYVDGMNVYEAVRSAPIDLVDSHGMFSMSAVLDIVRGCGDNLLERIMELSFAGTKQCFNFPLPIPSPVPGTQIFATVCGRIDIMGCCENNQYKTCVVLDVTAEVGIGAIGTVRIGRHRLGDSPGRGAVPPLKNWKHPISVNQLMRNPASPGRWLRVPLRHGLKGGCPQAGWRGQLCITGSIGVKSWTAGGRVCIGIPGFERRWQVGMGIGSGTSVTGGGGFTYTKCW